jgi:hypothetical protein
MTLIHSTNTHQLLVCLELNQLLKGEIPAVIDKVCTHLLRDRPQNGSCKFPLTDTRVAPVQALPFCHETLTHPQCTEAPTMHLASCSHQQQVERDIVASVLVVLVVSCVCLGCACFFLWLLDIVASILVLFLVFSCDSYQSQVQRDILERRLPVTVQLAFFIPRSLVIIFRLEFYACFFIYCVSLWSFFG